MQLQPLLNLSFGLTSPCSKNIGPISYELPGNTSSIGILCELGILTFLAENNQKSLTNFKIFKSIKEKTISEKYGSRIWEKKETQTVKQCKPKENGILFSKSELNMLKENNYQFRHQFLIKLPFKNESEIKTFGQTELRISYQHT